jgi:hypothetical protein
MIDLWFCEGGGSQWIALDFYFGFSCEEVGSRDGPNALSRVKWICAKPSQDSLARRVLPK